MKTLIMGIGNPILKDDSVGLKIAQKLKEANPGLEVIETNEAGITILEQALGFDKLIVIDSIKTGQGEPGQVYKLGLDDLRPATDFCSSHGLDMATAIRLGQKLGYDVPNKISFYAIEVKDNTTFAEQCSQEIKEKLPSITRQIIAQEQIQM